MSFVFTIEKQRYRQKLSRDEIRDFVKGAVDGSIPDYQLAAMCMAISLNGMSDDEIRELIVAMLEGGGRYDIGRDIPDAIEQHTTGGVGDGIDLTLLPLLATVGLHPAKLTAPAIGISSGIIDKVDSIPGMSTMLDRTAFLGVIRTVGCALANHGPDLVPADARLYAIRDVTATVDSIALIAGSILSKKLATGAPYIHISVKYGRAALLKTRRDGMELARLMAEVATAMGRNITVPLIRFDGALGQALGLALEIKQAIAVMQGGGPADLRQQIVAMGAQILQLVGRERNVAAGRALLEKTLDSGKVYEKFCDWIAAQGGDRRTVENPALLPTAPVMLDAPSPADGTVLDLDPRLAGELSISLGGGRLRKGDPLDHRVGLVLHRRSGERVTRGEPLFTVHAATPEAAENARRRLASTYLIGEGAVRPALVEEEVFGLGQTITPTGHGRDQT
jgi:pyrimidine-nucleoside phosphorylase